MAEAVAARELPILFSDLMILAILSGKKTQTRRVISPQPNNPSTFGTSPIWGRGIGRDGRFHLHAAFSENGHRVDRVVSCPFGAPGDRLWVREAWQPRGVCRGQWVSVLYRADGAMIDRPYFRTSMMPRWRPSIHMPRVASRITLEIMDIRVDRIQYITDEDAIAEGIEPPHEPYPVFGVGGGSGLEQQAQHRWIARYGRAPVRTAFAKLWDTLNSGRGYSWESNPWVWALTFKKL